MKRKFLAALLALVMVFSMIPVSASAEETVTISGDTPLSTAGLQVDFSIHTEQLYKLVMSVDNDANSSTKINNVTLLLKEPHVLGAEHNFTAIDLASDEQDEFHLMMYNTGNKLDYTNIRGLRIAYTTNEIASSYEFSPNQLHLVCSTPTAAGTQYEIYSSNTEQSIVIFYDNGDLAQGATYSVYDAYLIPTNTTMQSQGKWPTTPSYSIYHFVNWDLNKAGGSPFLQTSVVDGDKEVFSQKSALGDETIGTEIHVINTQNELKTRFVELYNAANDSDITVDDINWDTIKVSVADTDGKETNPNYNTGALPNEWREYQGETYYWVQNFDADLPGLEDTSYYNEHIAFDKITSMTVSADVNGQTYTYTIYKGSDKGDFAVSQLAGNTHIIEIHILAKPEKPDSDDLIGTVELPGILANGTVAIDCTTNNNHSTKTYGLKEGTYSVSDVKWSGSSSDGHYYADVTITDFEPYVMEYGDGHTPAENQGNDTTITVMYDNTAGAWTVPTNEIPVTYNVVCTTEPGGGDEDEPNVPTDDELKAALSGMIQVDCITNEEQHLVESYGVIDGGINRPDPDEVTKNGETYTYTVTVDSAKYLGKYSSEYGNHELVSTGTITITLQYDAEKETWYVDTPVTINVKCDSGTTDPEEPEEPTLTADDVIATLGTNAIAVNCIDNKHKTKYFALDGTTVSLGEVTGNEYIGYQCDVTVTLDIGDLSSYLADYNAVVNPDKHDLVSTDTITRTITLKCEPNNGVGWYFPGACPIITIDVTCASGETTPDPTPDPTPTPGPGGGDKPPYIPPVDPDDSGVSDLLNTEDHIQYLFGYPEGTFGPENNMTRAEVAQMFYNLLLDQDVTITKTFDDVPANAWYAKAVNTLASLGVVSGVGNGDFEPERSITRAEFTSIAMKFAEGKTGGTNIFSDVKSTDWFYRAVVNSTQYGWIHGYGDGTFRPNNPITRVEVTAIVNNMLGREADVDFVTEHYDELNHFSDLAVSHWGYYHIVEATNDHDYTKPSSGENWTELN